MWSKFQKIDRNGLRVSKIALKTDRILTPIFDALLEFGFVKKIQPTNLSKK